MTDSTVTEDNSISTAAQHAAQIRAGYLTSEALVEHCLDVIAQTEDDIGAWVYLDKDKALEQSRAMDDIRKRGAPTGALHGIPVGVKDIYDTADFPTCCGTAIYADRKPKQDCAVVEKLKEAGAVIMGKTVTTELAFMHPADTCNPHNKNHSPGGSSSGSAAAVAAGHVPLAIGSQTNGSVIRPASFCGVYGYKPSRGMVSRRGALQTSNTLDQVGVFSRDVGDLATLVDALSAYDRTDAESYIEPKPALLNGYQTDVPVKPAIAWIDMPYADRYEKSSSEGFEELLDELGDLVERIPAPQSFSALIPCHKIIHEYEFIRCMSNEIENHPDKISDTLKPVIEAANKHSKDQYTEALEIRAAADTWFKQFFYDYDAILTPSALGEAPLKGSGSTGDPVCCTIWTLCGLPCISMPLLTGSNNLPVGIQLVGALREDDRLFRTTRHVLETLNTR